MTLLAHISDLHLNTTPRAVERVRRVVDHLGALPTRPDALLVTGDIADRGDAAEYREAAELLDLPFPVLCCPGNHDDRDAMRTVLLGEPDGAGDGRPLDSVHRVGEVTVLMCDSTIPGRAEGRLDEATAAWIECELAGPRHQGTALLVMHHPPVSVHHPYLDTMLLTNPEALADLLTRQPRIAAVLTGHTHTAAATSFAARPVLLAPAVASTLVMPPRPETVVDREAPVGYALHSVVDGRIVTHFRTVPDAVGQ